LTIFSALRTGRTVLYCNNGNGTFTDVTKEAGLWSDQLRFGAGCTFVDYNRDGQLDLFVSNYVRFSFEDADGKESPSNADRVGWGRASIPLYRNNGDGTFTDVTQEAGIHRAPATYGLTVVAAEFDEDGWQDIYVASDSTPSLLFMNNRDGTFREEGVLRGVALKNHGGGTLCWRAFPFGELSIRRKNES
jgi:hypothetical protein